MGILARGIGAFVLLLLSTTASALHCPNGCNPGAGPPTVGAKGFLIPQTCSCDWDTPMDANLSLQNGDQYLPYLNVQAPTIGATGNGTTDDTLALRAAFAQATGGIWVPKGTYIISPQGDGNPMLTPHSNTVLRCEEGATFKYKDQTLSSFNVGRMISNLDAFGNVTPLINFSIIGCTFDGNCRGNQPACTNGFGANPQMELVAILRGNNVHLQRNYFFDVPFIGAAYYTGINVHFDHNSFYDTGQFINNDPFQCNGCQDFTINGNTVDNTGEGLVAQNSTATVAKEGNGATATITQNGTINDNSIAIFNANQICQSNGVPFACCTGEKAGNSSGLCAGGQTAGGSIIAIGRNMTIAGNHVANANTINVESGRGFDTSDVTVIGNTMTDGLANCIGAFVITGGTENQIHRIHIVGNTCSNVSASGISVSPGKDQSAFDIDIDSNAVYNPAFTGILLQYPGTIGAGTLHDVFIQNNEIDTPCAAIPVGTCASILTTPDSGETFSNIQIKGNTMKGSARYQLWLYGLQSQLRVEDNTFLNPTTAIVDPGTVGSIAHWLYNRYVAPAFFGIVPAAPTIGQFISDEPVTFALLTGSNVLNTVSDGSRVFCSNCTVANPCTGGGTGAWADRIAGAWVCHT